MRRESVYNSDQRHPSSRRSGSISRKQLWALVGAAIMLISAAWLSRRAMSNREHEGEILTEVICAACGHSDKLDYPAMIDGVNKARAQGFHQVGENLKAPIGLCSRCNRPALYRAEACPHCGQPIVPAYAVVNGQPVTPKCAACGWTRAKPPTRTQ